MFEKPPQTHRQDGRPMKPIDPYCPDSILNKKPVMWLIRGVCAAVYGFWVALIVLFAIDHVKAEVREPEEKPAIVYGVLLEWTAPTSLEDGTPLPLEHITGYDVFHSLDGVDVGYLQWVPAQSRPRLSWHHQSQSTGKHCYRLRTVTEIYGKSEFTETICAEIKQAKPLPPDNVTVMKKGASL